MRNDATGAFGHRTGGKQWIGILADLRGRMGINVCQPSIVEKRSGFSLVTMSDVCHRPAAAWGHEARTRSVFRIHSHTVLLYSTGCNNSFAFFSAWRQKANGEASLPVGFSAFRYRMRVWRRFP